MTPQLGDEPPPPPPPLLMPRQAITDRGITHCAKVILTVIYTAQAGSPNGLCTLTLAEIGGLADTAESTLRQQLRILFDRGHLAPIKQPGKVTAWTVRNPGPWPNFGEGQAAPSPNFGDPRARARESQGDNYKGGTLPTLSSSSAGVALPEAADGASPARAHDRTRAHAPTREAAAAPRSSFDPSWQPKAAQLEDLRRLRPGLDLLRMAEDFRAYWLLRPDQKRANWDFEFRRWVLREKAWEGAPGESSPTHASLPTVPAEDPATGLTPGETRNVAWWRRIAATKGEDAAWSLVRPHLTPRAEAYLRQHPAEPQPA